MPKRSAKPNPTTVVGKNLLAIIEHEARTLKEPFSVNAWAKRHKLTQTTVERILKGQDPSTAWVEKIAKAARIAPWAVLVPDFDPQNPPVLYGAEQREFIAMLKQKIGPEILEEGNTRPGTFDEIADKTASDAQLEEEQPRNKWGKT